MWSILLLSLGLSADGFLAGISYGIRGISIPPRSLGIAGLCTLVGISLSMALGELVSDLLQPPVARGLGGAALVCLGLWQLWQGYIEYRRRVASRMGGDGGALLARWHLRPLGIVIQILHEPARADRDQSGSIDPGEAVALGVALGLDTLAAGFAASMTGVGPLLVAMVPLGLVVLIRLGLLLGRTWGGCMAGARSFLLPSVLLIVIGLLQMR
jgi:putative sporulation protein YtaF